MSKFQDLSAQGVASYKAGRLLEALEAFDAALALNPASVIDLLNRGSVLADLGRFEEALQALGQAKDLAVGNATMEAHAKRFTWSAAARYATECAANGEAEKAFELYEVAHQLVPDDPPTAMARVFGLNYMPGVSMAQIRHGSEAVAALAMAAAGAPTRHVPGRAMPAKLRVGFVSADFRQHPVARFLAPLGRLDRTAFELFAYSATVKQDEYTEAFKAALPNWREIGALSDDQLARQVLADGIDILVDLSGYSAGGRMGLFARKPAPIQVTWLGYFATTGLPTMDYVLASEIVLPGEHEQDWVEKVWRLPETYIAFQPPETRVPVGPLPALRNGYVTFGCFNNIRKISNDVLGAWAAILRQVPQGRLVLRTSRSLSPDRQSSVLRTMTELGIAPHRVELSPAIADYEAHLATYNGIDIALDTFPFAGATTTCEALWMGVPVVTRTGDRYVARMGENIMRAIGRPGLIAETTPDYVACAVALARSLEALAAERESLRGRFMASPMADLDGFARKLEDAFRGMWQAWCTSP